MAALVAPRLVVVTDLHAVQATPFGQHGEVEQLLGPNCSADTLYPIFIRLLSHGSVHQASAGTARGIRSTIRASPELPCPSEA
jgi:hypothetical protein